MKNSHLDHTKRTIYNLFKNSFVFDLKTNKELILNDCLNIKEFEFKNGNGFVKDNKNKKYNIYYFSKLSKKGFEYAKLKNTKKFLNDHIINI